MIAPGSRGGDTFLIRPPVQAEEGFLADFSDPDNISLLSMFIGI